MAIVKCEGMPCSTYCIRAQFIKGQTIDNDTPEDLELAGNIIATLREIVEANKCGRKKELIEAVETYQKYIEEKLNIRCFDKK